MFAGARDGSPRDWACTSGLAQPCVSRPKNCILEISMGVPTRNSSRCWANHHCRVVRWIIGEEYLREAMRGNKRGREQAAGNSRRRVFPSDRSRTLLAASLVCMGDLSPPPPPRDGVPGLSQQHPNVQLLLLSRYILTERGKCKDAAVKAPGTVIRMSAQPAPSPRRPQVHLRCFRIEGA